MWVIISSWKISLIFSESQFVGDAVSIFVYLSIWECLNLSFIFEVLQGTEYLVGRFFPLAFEYAIVMPSGLYGFWGEISY